MALNRKSVIQIFLLVLLVIGGAGAFLYQQDGGLGFLADLIGGADNAPKAPPPKPVAKATPPAAQPRPAA